MWGCFSYKQVNKEFEESHFCQVREMSETLAVGGIGISLEHATPSSDGFCVVREITRGGPVDISGYERSNGEVRRVQVGDWLLRVNDISCQDMPSDEIKRYIIGPAGTKVVVVFASRRDNNVITVQLERLAPLQPLTVPSLALAVARPTKQFNHIEMHTRHHDDLGGFSNSQRGRDRPGSQSDRGKGGRDEERGRERDRYNNERDGNRDWQCDAGSARDRDRDRGCDRDKQYTLTQRRSKQFHIDLNKQVMRISDTRELCDFVLTHAAEFNHVQCGHSFPPNPEKARYPSQITGAGITSTGGVCSTKHARF